MKKLFVLLGLFTIIATPVFAEEVKGFFYQDTVEPFIASPSQPITKMGTSVCRTYFRMVSVGDCSVKRAMEDGNINSLTAVDIHIKNILLYVRKETRAYGN